MEIKKKIGTRAGIYLAEAVIGFSILFIGLMAFYASLSQARFSVRQGKHVKLIADCFQDYYLSKVLGEVQRFYDCSDIEMDAAARLWEGLHVEKL